MTERPVLSPLPARKALGQHFLFDPDILRRIALAAGPVQHRTVIEIGPGPGGLTRELLDQNVRHLIAVEADPRFARLLADWPAAQTGQMTVLHNDARTIDWSALEAVQAASDPVMIIANLPYNVATPLLIDWLRATDWRGEMALMFQKEVAQRCCALAGDKAYGRLAVLVGAVCSADIAFTLPPGAFRPPPKVSSAVAVFQPLPETQRFPLIDALETVTMAAFGQRRKMLRTSLRGLTDRMGISCESWLESLNIDPTARPETLTQDQFRCLARAYDEACPS